MKCIEKGMMLNNNPGTMKSIEQKKNINNKMKGKEKEKINQWNVIPKLDVRNSHTIPSPPKLEILTCLIGEKILHRVLRERFRRKARCLIVG